MSSVVIGFTKMSLVFLFLSAGVYLYLGISFPLILFILAIDTALNKFTKEKVVSGMVPEKVGFFLLLLLFFLYDKNIKICFFIICIWKQIMFFLFPTQFAGAYLP